LTFVFDVFRAPGLLYHERVAEDAAELERAREEHCRISRTMEESHQRALAALTEALATEREKNQRPEITGEISNFQCFTKEGSEFGVSCDLFLCNVRPAKTGVHRIAIDAAEVNPRLALSISHLPAMVLDVGIGLKCELGAIVVLDQDVEPHDTVEVDLTSLKVYAIDDFGGRHLVRVAPGTMLFLEEPPDPRTLPDSD
jgi:hypothetical protein